MLDAKRAGPDFALLIQMNQPISSAPAPRSRKVWLYITLIVVLFLVGAVLALSQIGQFWGLKASLPYDELRKTQAKMAEFLENGR